ncbi:hypothetical protein HGRIS_011625 [Hohenbuehelia grisea]|uniref:Uncharacterized protein n=1 Tax=Hohenbuehelia grisea TaxID=104357 RepID=A0ABR3JWQ9_9AGAR
MQDIKKDAVPLTAGVAVNMALYVIVCYLAYLGSVASRELSPEQLAQRNGRWMRAIIFIIFFVQGFHASSMIFLLKDVWSGATQTESGPTNPITWSYAFVPLDAAVTSLGVHAVQLIRILTFAAAFNNRRFLKWCVLGCLVLTATGACGFGTATSVRAWILKDSSKFSPLNWAMTVWLSMQLASDAITSITLISSVYSHSGPSQRHYRKLVLYNVTLIWVPGTVCSAAALLCFYLSPSTKLYAAFEIPIGNIYIASLLARHLKTDGSRNSRTISRVHELEAHDGHIAMSPVRSKTPTVEPFVAPSLSQLVDSQASEAGLHLPLDHFESDSSTSRGNLSITTSNSTTYLIGRDPEASGEENELEGDLGQRRHDLSSMFGDLGRRASYNPPQSPA